MGRGGRGAGFRTGGGGRWNREKRMGKQWRGNGDSLRGRRVCDGGDGALEDGGAFRLSISGCCWPVFGVSVAGVRGAFSWGARFM